MTVTAAKRGPAQLLRIPDVAGLSLKNAALAYGQAGLHVLPTRLGDVKNPGSIVGSGWNKQASCDLAQIEKWWSDETRIGGIAFHPGPSGAVVFDLDRDEQPDDMPPAVWDALHTGVIHGTRRTGERAHYIFACEPDEFSCSAGGFMRWGQVRSRGGVVILAPTPHPDADTGKYHWRKAGKLPILPDVLREMLSAPGQDADPKTPEELKVFFGKHTENNEPHGLQGLLTKFDADIRDSGSRHDAMRDALPWAFRESRLGRFSAQMAYDSLKHAFYRVKPEAMATGEFARLAQWAAAQAELADLDELRARVDRESAENASDETRPTTVRLSDVPPKRVEWLWKGWLPLGKLSLFEGESDVGKSTITLSWASIVSTGARWPETVTADGQTMISRHEPAGVVLVGIEDSNADTVVPRLIAAGANLQNVHSLTRPVGTSGNVRPFTIPQDIDWLRRAIVDTDARLVIIDPISACLPEDAKHGVDSSIRRILMSLVDLAEETGAAIVMIRHFNKSAGMSAKNRGGGSVAYTALVRSVLQANQLLTPTDTGATHAIALAVGNLSKKLKSLTYTLEDAPRLAALPAPEDEGLGVAVVKYCGTSDLTADQLVGADGATAADARKTAPMRDDAEEAIREVLENGDPQEMKSVIAHVMHITGCKEGTVKNAGKKMGVLKKSVYQPGKKGVAHWTWQLPPTVLPRLGPV